MPETDSPTFAVDVCIGTYRRPRGLRTVLEGVAAQRFTTMTRPDIHVVVVDNDPAAAARAVVETAAAETGLTIAFVAEPRRGIAHVRNTAVASTREAARFIAFLDDDELPEPQWLEQLLLVQAAHDADAVAGPVVPSFEQVPPRWMQRGRFHDRPTHPTGTRLPYVGTGNVVVRSALLRTTDEPFDHRLALSGGEDTLFFLQLTRAGGSVVWAADAVVHETVPASRATAGWILRRAYRGGNAFARCEAIAADGARPVRRWVNRFARGVLRILRGLARVLVAPLGGGRAGALEGLRTAANGLGVLTALVGAGFDEYVRTHGD